MNIIKRRVSKHDIYIPPKGVFQLQIPGGLVTVHNQDNVPLYLRKNKREVLVFGKGKQHAKRKAG